MGNGQATVVVHEVQETRRQAKAETQALRAQIGELVAEPNLSGTSSVAESSAAFGRCASDQVFRMGGITSRNPREVVVGGKWAADCLASLVAAM